ncbi:hypothetical protein LTR78_009554 [Recurvomyces mirabilis]|uniref:Large ribosomal subunit protein bL21m n=1 Tax=Recurvomyces mirabilis TaxID=574656 RepID=A0AAE0TRF5_9PEZI|nr:hypothetical protein LTR78_009554 [Recurvomyces mirabilis]KAK5149991.1 hypothetical protein LTS14_010463 [Recurvomyces mirabilis]
MLTRNLKRVLLDSQWSIPPTFLLPWAACLTTVSHATEANNLPPPLVNAAQHVSSQRKGPSPRPAKTSVMPPPPPTPELPSSHTTTTSPPALSDTVRQLLPILQAQGPHFITAHLYDRPYLLTQGDTVRLPFHMKGVEPGDILRLNCASNLGSRDYTLKPSAPSPKLKSTTTMTITAQDPTTGQLESHSAMMPEPGTETATATATGSQMVAPHFIPHIAKGKVAYLDERLYVCRAVVMGVESEPMQTKEKTKRRQRKVKTVKSKHRHTILRIKEVRVRGIEEIEGGVELE